MILASICLVATLQLGSANLCFFDRSSSERTLTKFDLVWQEPNQVELTINPPPAYSKVRGFLDTRSAWNILPPFQARGSFGIRQCPPVGKY